VSRAVPMKRSPKQPARRQPARTGSPSTSGGRAPRRTRPGFLRRLVSTWFLGKLLALALLATGGWVIWQAIEAPQLNVKRITVSGNELLPAEEITAEMDAAGTNIFWARRARLARMVRTVPAIQDADVQVRFPDQIHIVVREREPVAIWHSSGQGMFVDPDGFVLRESDRLLPTIIARDTPVPMPGDRVDPEAIKVAQQVTPRLEALGLADAQLEYRPSSGITLVSRGRRVALGFADNLDAKLDAYRSIRDHLTETQTVAELVDVRFLNRPYFR
jgi:cell division septal protein FtsQ